MQEDLVYSNKEKILFNIVGYVDNSDNVDELIKVLEEGTDILSEISNEERNKIKTQYINKSSRYKYMRVFYVVTENIPVQAFQLGNDWSMAQWLAN